MTLIVLSDTHNTPQRVYNVLQQHADADACIFLGDGIQDIELAQEAFPSFPIYSVQGNCDWTFSYPTEGLAPFGGLLFFYTHGNQHRVKQSYDDLWQAAHAAGADVALFGHTHIPFYEYREGVHLFNPGSLGFPRTGVPTYGLITVEDGKPNFAFMNYE